MTKVSHNCHSTVPLNGVCGEMHIYSSGKNQQTMLLCNVGQGMQRFQGGVWNAAVVKFHFLCSPIHPSA